MSEFAITRNVFDFIGKLKIKNTKDTATGKNNPNWIYNQISINLKSGDNNLFMNIMGGCLNGKDITVKGRLNEDGEEVEINIPFDERLSQDNLQKMNINNMYMYKVFRPADENTNAFKDYVNVYSFVTEYDFTKWILKNLKDDMRVRITGELSYQEYNGKVSRQYRVRNIYILGDNHNIKDKLATKNTIIINNNSLSEDKIEENNSIIYNIKGFQYYKNKDGGNIVEVPFKMSFDKDKKELAEKITSTLFKVNGDEVKAIKVKGSIFSGTKTTEVKQTRNTEEMELFKELFGDDKLEEAKQNMVEMEFEDINIIEFPLFNKDKEFDIDYITYKDLFKNKINDNNNNDYYGTSEELDDDDLPF